VKLDQSPDPFRIWAFFIGWLETLRTRPKEVKMKKAIFASIVALSLLVCVNAYGASLTYAPDRTSVTVEPGFEVTVPLTITIPDIVRGTYYLWFIDSDLSVNPPLSWVTASTSHAVRQQIFT